MQCFLFRDDTIVDWWLALYTCGQLWYSNDVEEASKLYKEVEDFPELYQVKNYSRLGPNYILIHQDLLKNLNVKEIPR